MRYLTTIGDEQFVIDIDEEGQVTVNDQVIDVDMQQMLDTTMYSILISGESHDVRMREGEGLYTVQLSGEIFEVLVEDERTRRLAGLKGSLGAMAGEVIIKAPMPGVVVEICVKPGQEVEPDQVVAILESMKMQNEFKAPRAGNVHTVRVAAGEKVDQNAIMLTIT
jgi:acetyl/propionyl-CoA carboxylase alpha subunit